MFNLDIRVTFQINLILLLSCPTCFASHSKVNWQCYYNRSFAQRLRKVFEFAKKVEPVKNTRSQGIIVFS